MDGGAGQAAQLDLAGDALDQLVALLVRALVGQAHSNIARLVPAPGDDSGPAGAVAASAASKAW